MIKAWHTCAWENNLTIRMFAVLIPQWLRVKCEGVYVYKITQMNYVYKSTHLYICVHIYLYMYEYVYIYIYIYI